MVQIKQLVLNPFQENTYIVYDKTGDAIIIDPGCYSQSDIDEVTHFVDANGLKIKCLIITHGHIDHILGIDALKSIYKVDVLGHADDLPLIKGSPEHAEIFGLHFDQAPTLDRTITDGEKIIFGNINFEIIHTPGHSKGGVCIFFREQKVLFTGDTLFNGSIGRTDLLGGNYENLIDSIQNKIFTLGDDVQIYPGHGNFSTIGYEKKNNPFFLMN